LARLSENIVGAAISPEAAWAAGPGNRIDSSAAHLFRFEMMFQTDSAPGMQVGDAAGASPAMTSGQASD
jgi:hypothetical protein